MANIGTDLRQWMLNQSDINEIVGEGTTASRIYPEVLPQNATLPAIVIRIISQIAEADVANGDANYSHTRIQVDSYATTAIGSQDLAYAVRKSSGLQGFTGTMGTVTADKVYVENANTFEIDSPTDGSDAFRYVTQVDYIISYQET